ncbi:MAG: iron ABC transporter permease [Candidatus Carbobacillus altaicus]|nr:iron ABC transporter permease [Candidatus Carbobacillus altaicus]
MRMKYSDGLLFLLIGFFFTYPLLKLLYLSFSSGQALSELMHLFSHPRTWTMLKNTLLLVSGGTVLAVFLGTSLALIMTLTDFPGRRFAAPLIFLPFILPSYIIALSWGETWGRQGLIAMFLQHIGYTGPVYNVYSLSGMIWVMGLTHYPLVYVLVTQAVHAVPQELFLVARLSGATRSRALFQIVLPLLKPAIGAAFLLSFLAALDNFGIPTFLGIPAGVVVLSTYIYEQIIGFGPAAFVRAALLSTLLMMTAIIALILMIRLFGQRMVLEGQGATVGVSTVPLLSLGRARWVWGSGIHLFLFLTSVLPLFSLIKTSLTKAYGQAFTLKMLTFDHYIFLFTSSRVHTAFKNSFVLALTVALLSIVIGAWISYRRVHQPSLYWSVTDGFMGLPFALPGIVTALSLIVTWIEPFPGFHPGVYGTIWMLFIAYFVRFSVVGLRFAWSRMSTIDPHAERAAAISGASLGRRLYRIIWPMMRQALIGGALMIIFFVLTELTVSMLLSITGQETLGVVVFQFEQGGYTTLSSAMSVLIALFMVIIAFILQKIGFSTFYLRSHHDV